MTRIAILGLGNSLLGDDAVGLKIAQRLSEIIKAAPPLPDSAVGVFQDEAGGWEILDHVEGYQALVLVDSIQDPALEPGTLAWYPRHAFSSPRISGVHNMDIFGALDYAHRHGMIVPTQVHILGVAVREVTTFTEQCTPPVDDAIPKAVDAILAKVREIASTAAAENR